ncbi:hypothetical protein [Leptolyngbya sp. GB1-A1]
MWFKQFGALQPATTRRSSYKTISPNQIGQGFFLYASLNIVRLAFFV